MLILPIKKKWFDMILSGEKKEEYREIKEYWTKRFGFENTEKERMIYLTKNVIFKNGYSKNSPKIKCYVKIEYGFGKEEWGAEPNKLYYVLKILSVERMTIKENRK